MMNGLEQEIILDVYHRLGEQLLKESFRFHEARSCANMLHQLCDNIIQAHTNGSRKCCGCDLCTDSTAAPRERE